ncbi:MAG: Slp family lipoprotein [Wenzhouxiangella sp.]
MTDLRSLRLWTWPGLVLLLSACASSPLATDDQSIAPFGPAHVLSGESMTGDRVIWGGRIAAVRNLAEFTELTVVSYPLDRADRPRVQSDPGVRFLLRQPGFLEPVQYTPGRFLSVLGTVAGVEQTPVGEYWLELPVLEAEQLHLWPADLNQWQSQTRFNIGVGIRL